jgi:hypothetical protein
MKKEKRIIGQAIAPVAKFFRMAAQTRGIEQCFTQPHAIVARPAKYMHRLHHFALRQHIANNSKAVLRCANHKNFGNPGIPPDNRFDIDQRLINENKAPCTPLARTKPCFTYRG